MVQGPATQVTPLQVACAFEYTEGDITNPPALPAALNGLLHLDQALHGIVTTLRKTDRFSGHELQTLLIKPRNHEIAADQVLLVGVGARQPSSMPTHDRSFAAARGDEIWAWLKYGEDETPDFWDRIKYVGLRSSLLYQLDLCLLLGR